MKLIFFWGANAIEASATVSQCLTGVSLEPAGEFLLLLVIQMIASWAFAKAFKKDLHTVNTVSEILLLTYTAAKCFM